MSQPINKLILNLINALTSKPSSHHLLVALQLLGVFLSCWPVEMQNSGKFWLLSISAMGAVLGLVVLYYNRPSNFSIYPDIKPQAKLITSGPYRCIRHPMYMALIVMMLGISFYNGHINNFMGLVIVTVVVVVKALLEEKYLVGRFSEYQEYCSKTRRFIPYLL